MFERLARIVVLAVIGCFSLAGAATAADFGDVVGRAQNVTTSDMTVDDPLPPADIYRALDGESLDVRHHDLATFAWLEFIALNAPADLFNRGEPDGSFADSGFAKARTGKAPTLVWETYQHRSELFPFGDGAAVPPQPWNSTPKYVFSNGLGLEYEPTETNFNNLDESNQIGQNYIFFPGLDDALDAQILFEAKVNEVQWDFVNSNYDGFALPITLPDNTIEVKSAWLPLDAIPEEEQYRYHTSEVIIYGGTEDASVATTETRALLALHIIHKTPNYPAFIFATFEHTDLLESPTGEPTGVYYIPTYDEIGYELPETTNIFPGVYSEEVVDNPTIRFNADTPVARPSGKRYPLPVGSVEDIEGAVVDEVTGDVLIPVTQPPTTNGPVARENKQVLRAMAGIPGFDETFVWQYYFLKGVQGVPTSDDRARDYYLANIVIESSQPGVQLFRGGTATADGGDTFLNPRNQLNVVDEYQGGEIFSVGGCQGCHGVAQTEFGFDFSFLFFGREGGGFSPDPLGILE